MNGDIDLISHAPHRKILNGSNSCSGHPSLNVQLTVESNTLAAQNDCTDYEGFSSGIQSAGSDTTCDENGDCGRDVNDRTAHTKPPSNRLMPPNSSLASTVVPPDVSDTISTCVSVFDSASVTQPVSTMSCFNPENSDHVFLSGTNHFGESKLGERMTGTHNEESGDNGFLNSLKSNPTGLENANELMLDVNSMQCQNYTADRIPRLDQDYFTNNVNLSSKTLQLFNTGDSNSNNNNNPDRDSCLTTNAIWNKANMNTHSDESGSFNFGVDPVPHLLSGGLGDPSINGPDVAFGCPQNTLAAAAKRAITGGHQSSRFNTTIRHGAWSNSVLPGPPSSIGSFTGNSWNSSSPCANKVNVGPFGSSGQMIPSGVSPNGVNSTPWSHALSQQQSQTKATSMNTLMGNMNINNNGTSNPRSSVNLCNAPVSSSFYPGSMNKNGNGLANIYSMFPKRPQHRMMAHWQQQQQHHNPGMQQNQLCKTPGMLQNTGMQLNGNRIPNSMMDVNSLVSPNGAAGDSNGMGAFNSSCSVLQSLSTINPIGSSGDTYVSTVPSLTTSTDSSLDSFKFGLDQQLMDVIKSLESSGMSNPNSGANTNNNNDGNIIVSGLDDVVIPSFSEVDQQFPNLNSMNHLSVLSQTCSSVNTSGMNGMNGTGGHNSTLRNMSVASMLGSVGVNNPYPLFANVPPREEGYSRKVFVGGLPPDIDEEEITTAFRRFGPLIVDWPHKTESKAYFPPKGYCFLLFQDERSVQSLIGACIVDEGKYYWCVSSPTMKDKPVQIRPWNLADSDFVMDGSQPLDPRKTIFVGGVPRPLRAIELALIMDRLYSGVCYAGIDTDPELKYPKGAGRVAFSNQQSYVSAISARFVQLQHNEIDKRVEVKPYVLDNQMCDECQGNRCGGKFAPFFCANVTCLQYYCEQCWVQIHSRNGREYHKPLVKEGAERPRPALYRW